MDDQKSHTIFWPEHICYGVVLILCLINTTTINMTPTWPSTCEDELLIYQLNNISTGLSPFVVTLPPLNDEFIINQPPSRGLLVVASHGFPVSRTSTARNVDRQRFNQGVDVSEVSRCQPPPGAGEIMGSLLASLVMWILFLLSYPLVN